MDSVGPNVGRSLRPLKWSEMAVDEKIEVLRKEIIYLRDSVSTLRRDNKRMKLHLHTQSGEIVIPLNEPDQYVGDGRIDPLSE